MTPSCDHWTVLVPWKELINMAEQQTFNQDLMTAVTGLKPSIAALKCQSWQVPWGHRLIGHCRSLEQSCGLTKGHQDVASLWLTETKGKEL